MIEQLLAVKASYERLEMTTDILMSIIERTGQFTEGYFALKVMTEHSKTINSNAFATGAASVEEAMELLNLQLLNIIATVEGQIERLER